MNGRYLDKITLADCREHLPKLEDDSIELLLSDIPYGIAMDDWDVLHSNQNSALLGESPAQQGKPAFKRRGKPINGWSRSDRNIGKEYEDWCRTWAHMVFPKLKSGGSVLLFGARRTIHRVVNAFEDSGFLLKDMLAWKKKSAYHRAQRVSVVFQRRGLATEAEQWKGWRLGNLAPMFEPIAWLTKPYCIGGTIADNVLEHGVGAMNTEACQHHGIGATNILEFGFGKDEKRIHEAQKPIGLVSILIELTTREGQRCSTPSSAAAPQRWQREASTDDLLALKRWRLFTKPLVNDCLTRQFRPGVAPSQGSLM